MIDRTLKANLIKYIKIFLKIGISALAIWYISKKIDFNSLWLVIKGANMWFFVVALIVYTVSVFCAAIRLNVLFRLIPLKISHYSNMKLYYMGLFYNFFLPGGVGGDGYKVFILHKYRHISVKKLIGVVLSDRVSGLSVILVYMLSLVYFINYHLPYQGWFWALIPTIGIGYYLFLYFFNRSLTQAFWKIIGWSLLIQGIQMLVAILILEGMGAKVMGHRDDFVFLFLLSGIAAAVPISLGGIGLREVALLQGALILGLNQDHAVALSLIFYSISLIAALPGIYYVIHTNKILDKQVVSFQTDETDIA